MGAVSQQVFASEAPPELQTDRAEIDTSLGGDDFPCCRVVDRYARALGVSRILHRLGYSRPECQHALLRSDQPPSGVGLAAVYRLGFAGRIRAGRPLAAYLHLMRNADLTWAQDLGAVTELLSGESFQPLGRSSSHQAWSSAMVASPALRGLFGLEWDALHHTLRLAPNLPAAWDRASLRNVSVGDARVDLEYVRENGHLVVHARSATPVVLCLVPQDAPRDDCRASPGIDHMLELPLAVVELSVPHRLPLPGSKTTQLKVVSRHWSDNRLEIVLEGRANAVYELPVRLNQPNVRATGAVLSGNVLRLHFPAGDGYRRCSVSFEW